MEEINKIFSRLREKTFTKKDSKGNMCNEWVDCLSYNDDIQPIKELILSEIEVLKAENEELKVKRDDLYERCYKKANLTPDCNPYYCVLTLAKENAELKERSIELPYKAGEMVWVLVEDVIQDMTKTADEQPKPFYKIVKSTVDCFLIKEDKIIYILPYLGHFEVSRVFKSREAAEARLKKLREEK